MGSKRVAKSDGMRRDHRSSEKPSLTLNEPIRSAGMRLAFSA
jgi:hypothetical protein